MKAIDRQNGKSFYTTDLIPNDARPYKETSDDARHRAPVVVGGRLQRMHEIDRYKERKPSAVRISRKERLS